MKNFNGGGRGLSNRQSDHVNELSSYHVLSSRPIERNNRLLHFVRNDERELECNDEDRGSHRTTFVQASPLLRPYITHSSPFQYLFNTSASRILDQNVMKTCSEGDETPKQVRSRSGSGQEPVGHQDDQLSSAQVLPLFCFGSTVLRSVRDRSPIVLRSLSENYRSAIGGSSEKGRTRLGLGRYQVGAFSAYWWPIGCSFFGVEARTDQRICKEQANKYQTKPKPSPKKEQRIGKELAENKQGISREGVANTWVILRQYTESASTRVAGWFGVASRLARTRVQTGSTVVRPLFESCSGVSRSPVEGESNSTRRSVEDESNTSRSAVEEVSNTSRSAVEGQSKSSRTLVEAEGARTKVELALTQPITRVELGMNYQTTKDELRMSLERTKDKTRKWSSEGEGDCFVVVPPTRNDGEVVEELREKRLILKGFRELCEEFRVKVGSVVAGDEIKREKGLKCVRGFVSAKTKLKSIGEGPLHYGRGDGRVWLSACLIILCVLFNNVFAQSPTKVGAAAKAKQEFVKDIRGTVIDAVTKKLLAGVGVEIYIDSVKYAGRYALDDGTFDFKGAHITHGTLRISKAGYIKQEIPMSLSQNGPYDVALRPEAIAIEEVEVISTGFFNVPKERATGSFTHVNNELLSRSVGSNVIDRLKDVVLGLTFNQSQIGKSAISNEPSISIRGRSTMKGNAEPLVILDNFPYEGKIEDINPEDIESVTILQDAAAASIWGARAGNGVIVLTSKQGHREQPLQVSIRSDYSISAKPDLYYAPIIPMDEFIEVERFLFNKNAWNPYINQGYSYITPAIELLKQHRDKKLTDMELESALDVLKGQDVRRDLSNYFYRPSSLRKTFLSFNGGGKKNTYYFSAGYDQKVSDKVGADNQRISINMRNSYEVWKDKLRLDVGLLFAKALDRSDRSSSAGYNVLYDRLVDDNGNPLSIGGSNKFRQIYIDTAGNGLLKDWNYRPVEEIGMNPIRVNNLNYQLSTGFEYNILEWVNIQGKYQYSSGTRDNLTLWDAASFQMRNLYNQFTKINHAAGTAKSAIPEGGQLNATQSTFSNQHGRAQLAVDKDWNVHRFSMILGAEVNKRQTYYTVQESMLGYQPATETYTPMDLIARYPQYHVTSLGNLLVLPTQNQRETTDNRNVLLFGNASYSYDRRYTATFSVRKDRANIFGVEANKKGKPFMSAGMLWNLHEEAFVQLPWLQKLSLRGTMGTMGNVSMASAYLTSQVGAIADPDNGRKFQRIITAPNPLLSWEKVRMLNVAMDFSLFNSKLSGTVERYYRTSTDLLSYNPMNPSSGVSTLYGNWSAMKSSGWDISLNSRLRYGDFSWNGNLIFSHIKDQVTDYYEKPTSVSLYLTSAIGQYPIEGKPLNAIYSLPYAGLDSKGDPLGYLDGHLSTDYAEIYNNTPLSEYVYHGRATPNTFGSLRNSFGYKGVELSFMLSYQLGYYFRQQAFSSSDLYMVTGYGSSVFQSQYLQRWQQTGDEATTRVPAAVYPVNGNREVFYGMTEDHVQRGDHIRFRDIRLSYSFPGLKNSLIRNLQVYGYVDNVGLLWTANENGFDPLAIPNAGLKYPTPRTYALGVNLKI